MFDQNNEVNKYRLNSLIQKFEQYFKIKGYKPDSYFDNKVFFLRNDQNFQNFLSGNTPYQNNNLQNSSTFNNNKILEILNQLNKGNDFQNLYISTKEFTQCLCKLINDSNISIQISEENIVKNNSHQKIGKINEIINLLNSKVTGKKKGEFNSILYSNVNSMSNFENGPYRINLCINTDFEKENFNELNSCEQKNLESDNTDNVYNYYESKILNTKNLITIPNGQENVTFRNNMKLKSEDENDVNFFEDYNFSILEHNNKDYLVDRRNSGTNFASFKLKIRGSNDIYESNNNYLLHIFLSSIEDLCDLNKEILSKNINVIVKGKNDENDKNRIVSINLNFEIDNLTRIGILKRVKELINIPVENKVKNQMLIDEILNDYFPEMKESTLNILESNEEKRENCCADCVLF